MTTPDPISTTPVRVYTLLPAIYQLRDQELGEPLKQLLAVVDDQLKSLESDIDQLYDDMFIETCQGPLIDYFADLVAVHLGPLTASLTAPNSEAAAWVSRRHQVVNAIAARAAKGTLTALERVVADATGWPVRAVEEGLHLAVTHSTRHPDARRARLLDTHDDAPLLRLGGPFATASALADVRRGDSTLTKPVGPHPTTVTVTIWRQEVTHIHRAPAACVDDDNYYTFDALGYDRQLAVAPTPRRPGTPPAGDLDLPVPITRRQLRRNLADYYGTDRSVCIYRGRSPIPRDDIVVADLSAWRNEPDYDQVALDPQTGRIAFPASEEPEDGIWVRYHYLDVGPVGAGGVRDASATSGAPDAVQVVKVAAKPTDKTILPSVTAAIDEWLASARKKGPSHGVIEILDSSVYEEDFDVRIGAGLRLDIRAAAGQHPVLRSVDEQHNRPKRVRIEGYSVKGQSDPARLSLTGITIAEHALELNGEFAMVALDHCTVVPEREDADRRHVAIAITAMPCPIEVTSSIIGVIRVNTPEVGYDPIDLSISDSIMDAGSHGGHAVGGIEDRPAYAALTLNRCTVLGEINIFQTTAAHDSIITGRFHSRRRQTGEIRFCYLPPTSHVPRRIGCQPDGVLARVSDDLRSKVIDPAEAQALAITETARVRPRFDSTEFGSPGYARLTLDAAAEITHGSEDDGELGAFHDLWLTRRIDDMTARLAEFTPIGVDVDIVFAN
jgi:hypothetical protein